MKELVICTMFRDSMLWNNHKINQVDRFFKQMKEQSITFDICALEGDSVDNTYKVLCKYGESLDNLTIIKHSMGATPVTSDPVGDIRYRELALLANTILYDVQSKYRYMLWIESDLIILNPRLIEILLNNIKRNPRIGCIAPMVWIQNPTFKNNNINPKDYAGEFFVPTIFYDGWGFQSRFVNFKSVTPYNRSVTGIIEASSVGSCVMTDLEFLSAQNIDFGIVGCLKGLCHSVAAAGKLIKINTDIHLFHPGQYQVRGRWI